MAWIAVGTAAFQVVAGTQEAETTRANAAIVQQINDMNAKYAELDAYNATQAGISKSARYQGNIDQIAGTQREDMAAKGQDVNFGTGAEITAQTKVTGFLNQLDIKNYAQQKAMGYENEAMNYRLASITGGAQAAATAAGQQTSAIIGGANTLLSGYSKTARPGTTTPNGDVGTFAPADGYLGNYDLSQ